LTCFYQALLILIWFRKHDDVMLLGAGFGISRATAYRYLAEGIAVLAARRPYLHEALQHAADDGWAFVILDGKLFDCDRVTETVLSVRGDSIDAWYSGKHRDFGANIQAIMLPNGLPIWTADAMPGHLHDLTWAQNLDITAALNWAAAELNLPTWPIPDMKAQATASRPLPGNPPTANSSPSPTAASTGCYAAFAGKANAGSPSWQDAGNRCVTAQLASEGSVTSSRQRCTSPTSNTAT
jgi:DDE superfamily endonuclease